jgi:hypothetical protein
MASLFFLMIGMFNYFLRILEVYVLAVAVPGLSNNEVFDPSLMVVDSFVYIFKAE